MIFPHWCSYGAEFRAFSRGLHVKHRIYSSRTYQDSSLCTLWREVTGLWRQCVLSKPAREITACTVIPMFLRHATFLVVSEIIRQIWRQTCTSEGRSYHAIVFLMSFCPYESYRMATSGKFRGKGHPYDELLSIRVVSYGQIWYVFSHCTLQVLLQSSVL